VCQNLYNTTNERLFSAEELGKGYLVHTRLVAPSVNKQREIQLLPSTMKNLIGVLGLSTTVEAQIVTDLALINRDVAQYVMLWSPGSK
jgi:hypothetical protein